MDDLVALRWLLELPEVPETAKREIRATDLPVVIDEPDQLHLFNGCRTAVDAFPTAGPLARPPAETFTTTLGEVVDSQRLCGKCLSLFINYGMDNRRAHDPFAGNLVKALPRYGNDLHRVRQAAEDPDLGFFDVPFAAMRVKLPGTAGGSDAAQASHRLDALHARAVDKLVDRLRRDRPHWLYVRYAVEQPPNLLPSGLEERTIEALQSGFDHYHQIGEGERRAVADLLDQTAAQLRDEPPRPVLVRHVRSSVSMTDRHFITPLEVIDDIRVLALPAPWAPYVGASERFRCDWLDLPDGWVHDPTTRDRIRTAASLWTGRDGDVHGRLADAYRAAAAIR